MLQQYVAVQRILAGATATLSWQPVDSDGEPAAPEGTVTVGVTKADGTAVVAAGTATTGTGTNPRTFAVTAAQTAALDVLVATWTDSGGGTATTLHEVVGGYYFTLTDARTLQPGLADLSKFSDEVLLDARTQVEDEFEDIAGCAFVPRYRRAVVRGTGGPTLTLPDPMVRTVRSVRVAETAASYTVFTAEQLAAITPSDAGVIDLAAAGVFPCSSAGLVVEYEHGMDRPPPDLKRLALVRLREVVTGHLNTTGMARAERYTSPEGTFVYSLMPGGPGGRRTGNPDIDAALTRYGGWDIGFA